MSNCLIFSNKKNTLDGHDMTVVWVQAPPSSFTLQSNETRRQPLQTSPFDPTSWSFAMLFCCERLTPRESRPKALQPKVDGTELTILRGLAQKIIHEERLFRLLYTFPYRSGALDCSARFCRSMVDHFLFHCVLSLF